MTKRNPPNSWTYDKCKEEISEMKYLNELQGKTILGILNKNGWYHELTKSLIRTKNMYWTKESIHKEAIKYKHRSEFGQKSKGAYIFASRRGWLDDVCSHMTFKCGVKKGESFWTKDKIIELAKNYNTRNEFAKGRKKGSNKVDYKAKYTYSIAGKNGWLDEVCSHMKMNINDKPRYIYAITWEKEKLAYVGLTQDWKKRFTDHCADISGIVYKTIEEFGEPKFKVVSKRPVKVERAGEYEERWKIKYEKMGYETINRVKTGSLGSYSRMWDYESVKLEALKYETKTEFRIKSGGAFVSALKNGWLDDIRSHMKLIMGYWDVFENVEEQAKKYRTRKDLQRGCRSASEGAYKNGWMDILYPKENMVIGDMGYWDIKENVIKVCLECKTKKELMFKYSGAYNSARRNGWLDEVCSHMEILYGKWKTIDDIKEEVKKYKSKQEFQKAQPGAYLVIRTNGWLKEVFSIFPKFETKWGRIETVKEEALKYNSIIEFYKMCGSAYNSARRNGWLDEVCSHMVSEKYPQGYWDVKENVIKESLKYKTRSEFHFNSRGSYGGARRNGWLDELFPNTSKKIANGGSGVGDSL